MRLISQMHNKSKLDYLRPLGQFFHEYFAWINVVRHQPIWFESNWCSFSYSWFFGRQLCQLTCTMTQFFLLVLLWHIGIHGLSFYQNAYLVQVVLLGHISLLDLFLTNIMHQNSCSSCRKNVYHIPASIYIYIYIYIYLFFIKKKKKKFFLIFLVCSFKIFILFCF